MGLDADINGYQGDQLSENTFTTSEMSVISLKPGSPSNTRSSTQSPSLTSKQKRRGFKRKEILILNPTIVPISEVKHKDSTAKPLEES